MTFRLTTARWATCAAFITAVALSSAGAAYAGGVGAHADSVAPPSEVTLDVVTVNGSGCPAGTATVTMLPDRTGFRVTYTSFVAQDGGAAKPTDIRKNCQINLRVHVPQGFTYAIARADYRGRVHLASGATGLHRTNYYFQGSSDNNYVDHPFAGPVDGAWRDTDITDVTELVYQPCGEVSILNINTELRVDSGTSAASAVNYLSMSASDGNVDTIVQFQWKRCG
ncbi:DUF4360 domain-containing protein [Planosporangium sp. 12N6]|uniref:DUF4360 domain-containing protein n=1 Tax=Planosporangium spinosum TaxID=3402278 RepID=UPI003CF4B840